MADERYSFSQARTRLEEIVTQVRKKDTSLEKSLDLLEEGVRLANVCTELSDHTEWRTVALEQAAEQEEGSVEESDADETAEDTDGDADAEADEDQTDVAEAVDSDEDAVDAEEPSDA